MGKLKIGLVLDDTLDTPDGVQQYVLTVGQWLMAQGHEVHYLVGGTTRADIPHVHSLSRNRVVQFNGNKMSTPLPAGRKRLKALLDAEQFDVLHVQLPYSPFMAGRLISLAPKRTVVFGTFHIAPNSSLVTFANRVLGIILKRSLKRFDGIVSVSQAAHDFAKQTYGIETSILPNVIVTDYFYRAKPMPLPAKPTVMFLGRLVPRKGCQYLLEAVYKLRQTDPKLDFQVIICGGGQLEATLRAYVQQHGLDKTVQFTGFIENDLKARYLKTADIAVFPSTGGESFGIVLIEAMAAQHPVVIGADNPGYATVLGPHAEALFPVADSSALADKLHALLCDEAMRTRAREWQKVYVHQFDVSVVGRRLVLRYNELLRARERT